MSWAAIASTVIGAGLSAGVAAASKPDLVNPATTSRRVSLASLRALPGQRQVELAARLGIPVDYATGRRLPGYENRQVSLTDALAQGYINQGQYDEAIRGRSGRNQAGRVIGPDIAPKRPEDLISIRVPTGGLETRHADFTGYGDADVQGKLAQAMAEIQLGLQQKYGTQFIEEAKKQEALADPEGTAARALLAEKINAMDEARRTRERPVADTLEAQMRDELARGRAVDPEAAAAAESILARRGDTTLKAGDVTNELQAGPLGDERLRQRLQEGIGYYGSGQSPTDAAYREEQQSLANMASFLRGQTPQSQFGSLRAGQQGASPMPQGPSLPGVSPDLVGQSQNAGLQNYQSGIRSLTSQVNPFFAGLNAIVQGIGTYQAAQRRAT